MDTAKDLATLCLAILISRACVEWHQEIRRRCTVADDAEREKARWMAYGMAWHVSGLAVAGVCAWAVGYLLLAGLMPDWDIDFRFIGRMVAAVALAAILFSAKAYFGAIVIGATLDWWLVSARVGEQFSFKTPLRELLDVFAEWWPEWAKFAHASTLAFRPKGPA